MLLLLLLALTEAATPNLQFWSKKTTELSNVEVDTSITGSGYAKGVYTHDSDLTAATILNKCAAKCWDASACVFFTISDSSKAKCTFYKEGTEAIASADVYSRPCAKPTVSNAKWYNGDSDEEFSDDYVKVSEGVTAKCTSTGIPFFTFAGEDKTALFTCAKGKLVGASSETLPTDFSCYRDTVVKATDWKLEGTEKSCTDKSDRIDSVAKTCANNMVPQVCTVNRCAETCMAEKTCKWFTYKLDTCTGYSSCTVEDGDLDVYTKRPCMEFNHNDPTKNFPLGVNATWKDKVVKSGQKATAICDTGYLISQGKASKEFTCTDTKLTAAKTVTCNQACDASKGFPDHAHFVLHFPDKDAKKKYDASNDNLIVEGTAVWAHCNEGHFGPVREHKCVKGEISAVNPTEKAVCTLDQKSGASQLSALGAFIATAAFLLW